MKYVVCLEDHLTMEISTITAPEHKHFYPGTLKIFLAGGICNCPDWQKIVIEHIQNDVLSIELSKDYKDICLINPRRPNWVEEPDAAKKQIEWEFDMLECCDVFTMYFVGSESDQPICMYELGRNIERMKEKFPTTWEKRIIITCDKNYKRMNDVLIQTSLATNDKVKVNLTNQDLFYHIKPIKEALKYIYNE